MKSRGLAQIPLMIVLLLMAVAVPVATKLVQRSADTRNLATHDACVAGVLNTFGCGKTGLVSVSGCPAQVYFNCLPKQFSKVSRAADCSCTAICEANSACENKQCLAVDMGTCTCPGGATGVNHRNGDCTFTCTGCPVPTKIPTAAACLANNARTTSITKCCSGQTYTSDGLLFCGLYPTSGPTRAPTSAAGSCPATSNTPALDNGRTHCQSPYMLGSRRWWCNNGTVSVTQNFLVARDCVAAVPTTAAQLGTILKNLTCTSGKPAYMVTCNAVCESYPNLASALGGCNTVCSGYAAAVCAVAAVPTTAAQLGTILKNLTCTSGKPAYMVTCNAVCESYPNLASALGGCNTVCSGYAAAVCAVAAVPTTAAQLGTILKNLTCTSGKPAYMVTCNAVCESYPNLASALGGCNTVCSGYAAAVCAVAAVPTTAAQLGTILKNLTCTSGKPAYMVTCNAVCESYPNLASALGGCNTVCSGYAAAVCAVAAVPTTAAQLGTILKNLTCTSGKPAYMVTCNAVCESYPNLASALGGCNTVCSGYAAAVCAAFKPTLTPTKGACVAKSGQCLTINDKCCDTSQVCQYTPYGYWCAAKPVTGCTPGTTKCHVDGELPLRPGALRPVFGITSKAVVTLDVLLQWIQLAESVKADVLRVKKV